MENIETSLEALLNEFNTDIRKNCDSGKSKQELEERYRSIMKQYVDKFSSALESINLSSNSNQEYLYSQFSVLNRHFGKVISEHGLSTVDAMVLQNNSEFQRNLEVLSETTVSDEEKKDEMSQNSKRKNSALEDEKGNSKSQDRKDSERFEDYLAEFSSDVIKHSLRVNTGYLSQREYMLKAAAAEAGAQGLKSYIDKLNKNMVEAYMQALFTHTDSMHEYYSKKDSDYLSTILDTVERSKDEKYDPFAPVSDEVQKKLKEVSKNAALFKNSSSTQKEPFVPGKNAAQFKGDKNDPFSLDEII